MKKIIIALVTLILIGAGIAYYFGFYTYFVKQEVNEPIPTVQSGSATSAKSPKTIAQGSFVPIDIIHKGSGTAKILNIDAKSILRFEDFSVTNGPDLYVYLSRSEKPDSNLESLGGYIELGRLKGNVGDQNYNFPPDANTYRTVVIWCKKYGVLFSYAVLR